MNSVEGRRGRCPGLLAGLRAARGTKGNVSKLDLSFHLCLGRQGLFPNGGGILLLLLSALYRYVYI